MELSDMVTKKKKKVSRKSKKSWSKHIDNKDVEEFLDNERLRERLGGSFTEKKDVELFVIDEAADDNKSKKLTKKEKARLPLKCYGNLVNNCKIPDPVGQRPRVKTKEERKCRIRKSIEAAQLKKGIVARNVLQSRRDRSITIQKKKREPKELIFERDVWGEGDKEVFGGGDMSWLKRETIIHHGRTLKVSVPKDISKKKSIVPAVEPPHPGTSYNPSLKDHQNLLNIVAEKEMEKLKEEAHIQRVTTKMFERVTRTEKEAQWIEEMSQGLAKEEDENEEPPSGPLSLNPPTSFLNKKTLKQRRKQKEQKALALARKYAKLEKKKKADISKLRFILKDIQDKEKKEEIGAQIREKKAELNAAKTKRLAARKFIEADLDFNRKSELKGNLRAVKQAGNLLADRFYSLQKRNILEPACRVTRFRKAKVKRFTKASHKTDEVPTTNKKKKK